MNWGKCKTVACDFSHLFLVVNDTAACSAKGESRSDNYRVSDFLCKFQSVVNAVNNLRWDTRLVDGLHCVFEHLSVLCLVDCFRLCAQKLNAVLISKSLFCKLH